MENSSTAGREREGASGSNTALREREGGENCCVDERMQKEIQMQSQTLHHREGIKAAHPTERCWCPLPPRC